MKMRASYSESERVAQECPPCPCSCGGGSNSGGSNSEDPTGAIIGSIFCAGVLFLMLRFLFG